MNHSIVAEGFGTRLRPVRMDDAAFLVWVRNQEHAKGKLGDSAVDTASQEQWLRNYFERENDYYFVIETTCGIPVGAIGYYNITPESGEIGRWVIWTASPAAVPSVIPAVDIGFQRLGLRELRIKVVSTNERAIKLYFRIGFRQTRVETAGQIINGEPIDLVHMVLTEDDWARGRKTLMPVALMLEVQVHKWEQQSILAKQRPPGP